MLIDKENSKTATIQTAYVRVIFCIALFSFAFNINGQVIKSGLDPSKNLHQFLVEQWTSKEGLPTNSLTDVMFSEQGFLWISSYNGIIIFDGHQFRIFNKSNLPLLKNNGVYRFFEGNDHDIWICTNGSGLLRYKNGAFERMYEDKLPDNVLTGFIHDGITWIGTINQGLYKIEGGEVEKIKFEFLNNVTIVNIDKDKDGTLWFSTDGKGISSYKDDKLNSHAKQIGSKMNRIQDIYCHSDGSLSIGTFEGLYKLEKGVLHGVAEFKGLIVSKIEGDDYGNLWMATNIGLARKNTTTNTIEFLEETTNLPVGELTSLEFDDQNNLWLTSTRDGLIRLRSGEFFNYTERQGLLSNRVNSFLELDNGEIMVGLENGKIQKIKGNVITDFPLKTNLLNTRIRNLYRSKNKTLWVSTYLGLLRIKTNGEEKLFTVEDGLPSSQIRQIIEDENGIIWAATRNAGVLKWMRNGEKEIINNDNGIRSNFILSLSMYNNSVVCNTNDGGVSIIDEDGSITNFGFDNGLKASVIFSNYIDDDKIWLATNAGVGVLVKDSVYMSTSNVEVLTEAIFDILEDDSGNLWMTGSSGIIKVDKNQLLENLLNPEKSLGIDLFDENDGLVTRECIGAVRSFKSSDGRLWFPTLEGLSVIDPNNMDRQTRAPKPFIISAYVDNKIKEITMNESLNPGFKRFTFRFTAPHFVASRKIKFMYKLEGYDQNWNQLLGAEREAQYTNLPFGQYEFRVRASNPEGVWSDEYAAFPFTIRKYFYQTIEFISIAILLSVFMIFGLYRWRTRSMENEKKRLEAIVFERTSEIETQKEEIEAQRDKLVKSLSELERAQKTINSQNLKLKDHNDELEDKVKMRTAELGEAMNNILSTNKELDHFLYRAAHDLRGPVLRLLGIVNLAQIDKSYLADGLFYKNLKDTIHEMDDLIRKLMRINELKNTEPNLTKVDLKLLITTVFEEMESKDSLELITKIDLNYCVTDVTLLRIILSKLFENSFQFMDGTKSNNYLRVEVGELIGSNMIRILVIDNGIGVENSIKPKIFNMFSKGHNKGFGLGLYVAKLIAHKLFGELNLIDEESNNGDSIIMELIIPDHSDKHLRTSN